MSDQVTQVWSHEFSAEQVAEWKAKYGRVFVIKIGSNEYVYRGLTNAEFELLRTEEQEYSRKLEQEGKQPDEISQLTLARSMKAVVITCTLFPENYETKLSGDLAGVLEILQPVILEASGFPSEPPEVTAL